MYATWNQLAIIDWDSILGQTKVVAFFTRLWSSIDWDHYLDVFFQKAVYFILLTIFFLFILKLGLRFIRSTFQHTKNAQAVRTARMETLYAITKNIYQYIIFFIAVYSYLTILGIPVGSLIAGAGIAGVAVGLGAQGFINDLITGFFIILERQVEVGDYVRINQVEGTVISIGLRTTQLKAADGTIHFLPNRTILQISNLSRSAMLVMIQISVAPTVHTEKIKQFFHEVDKQLVREFTEILEGPDFLGLVELANHQYAVQVNILVQNGQQYAVKRAFQAAYIAKLEENGIAVLTPSLTPFPVK